MTKQSPSRRPVGNYSELSEFPGESWHRMRILTEHSNHNVVIGELAEAYVVRETYEHARRKGDPYLSPHGMFRRLQNGNRKQAHEFLEAFGALTVTQGRKIIRVELDDFWAKQLQFCLVSELYEERDNREDLPASIERYIHYTAAPPLTSAQISEMVRNVDAAGKALEARFRKFGINRLEDLIRAEELEQALDPSPAEERKVEERVHSMDAEFVRHRLKEGDDPRHMALWFVERELRYHTRTGLRFTWAPGRGRDDDKFRLHASYDSLLTAIWDLFATDTTGTFWRICPNHGKLFYPSRSDRFYCTSKEQVAASKANYELRRNLERQSKARKKRRERKC